jgi:titin
LIIALVGVVIITGVSLLGGQLSSVFGRTAASLGAAGAGGAVAPAPVVPPAATVPGTVSGVSASSSSVNDGKTVLDWSAPSTGGSPITGYSVYRADEGSGNSCPSTGYSSVASSVTPPFNTGDDHDNCWRVAAVNAVGEGLPSTAVYHDS